MMQPMAARFYVYARNEAEIVALERALHDLVTAQYAKGALVTAEKLTETLRTFGGNPLITRYLNGK
jgi:hypothetical protein